MVVVTVVARGEKGKWVVARRRPSRNDERASEVVTAGWREEHHASQRGAGGDDLVGQAAFAAARLQVKRDGLPRHRARWRDRGIADERLSRWIVQLKDGE